MRPQRADPHAPSDVDPDVAVAGSSRRADLPARDAQLHHLGSRDVVVTVVPGRVFRILLVMIGVLVLLSSASRMVVLYLPDFPVRDSLANFLYVDVERSLPTLFSTGLMFTSALLCGAIAHARHGGGASDVRHWVVLSAVLGVLALDEFGQLHEKFMDPLRELLDIGGGLLWFAWVVPAIFLLAVFALFFVPFLGRLPRKARRGMLLAGLVFVGGAVGVEMIGASYAADHPVVDATYVAMVTVEESLEMLGMAILISTLLSYMVVALPRARWIGRVTATPPP